jgi:hypothetical protein
VPSRSDAPARTWQHVLAAVPEASPVGGLTAAAEPAATTVAGRARKIKRVDETPADLLADLEYEVSEPATRSALDDMRAWRQEQRAERERLDDLDAPDTRPWKEQQLEKLTGSLPFVALVFAIVPFGSEPSPDVFVLISGAAALIAAARMLFVQAGRAKEPVQFRGLLLLSTIVIVATPIIAIGRALLGNHPVADDVPSMLGLVAQVIAAVAYIVSTMRAPTAAQLAARRAADPAMPRDPSDDFYDAIETQVAELDAAVDELAPLRLRAALTGRDSAVARASRHTVVDAIRVLFEREQIGDDEAEWMLREALTVR